MASNYNKILFKDYENLQNAYDRIKQENKMLLLRAIIAEDEERRLKNKIDKYNNIISEKTKLIDELQRENERLKAISNNDGTNSGIPTSQTPIGKKKVIPNFAKNTGGKIGRKEGHKKDKL